MRKIICILSLTVCFLLGFQPEAAAKIHTPDHYENAIRQAFREGRWEAGKYMLDEARPYYGSLSPFLELDGWYFYHIKDYKNARRYLHNALLEDDSNTHARELIVGVEYDTKNYASAICYINELLETNPYSKGWWKKKIEIYRLQHNYVEADKLLLRLQEIYPDDSLIRNESAYRFEIKAQEQKKQGDIDGELASNQELLKLNPNNADYYIRLSNLLLQTGKTDEAMRLSGEGAARTGNFTLIKKHADILCSQGKHGEAVAFLREQPRSAMIDRLIVQVQEDQASYANANDPYTAYGRVYERSHSSEAFNYLVNTSISRGYYNDALYYINDYKKRNPFNASVAYKEYVVYKALGEDNKAADALYKAYKSNPQNAGYREDLSELYYKIGNEAMEKGYYSEAVDPFEFTANESSEEDLRTSAASKLSVCYTMLKKYDEAIEALSEKDPKYIQKKAGILALKGQYKEALDILENAGEGEAYAEMAIPYIKSQMEMRGYDEAAKTVEKALAYSNAKELYMYGITSAAETGRDKNIYIEKGLELYPTEEVFINHYAGLCSERALALRKEKQYDAAMKTVNDGLSYKPHDMELLYVKGLLYENQRQYDSAVVYLKQYKPSEDEKFAHNKKIQGYIQKRFKNSLTLEYMQGRPGNRDIITANAFVTYERKFTERGTGEFVFNYAGRDDMTSTEDRLEQQVPGGVGIQAGAGWTQQFDGGWTAGGRALVATKYFPVLNTKIFVSKDLPREWNVEGHLSYRIVDAYDRQISQNIDDNGEIYYTFSGWKNSKMNMFTLGGSGLKMFDNGIDFSFGGDAVLLSKSIYYNAFAKGAYHPVKGSRTSVYATAGAGTAPEVQLIDTSMPASFEKINTFVGAGGVYTLNPNVDFGLNGTWYTLYMQYQPTSTNAEFTFYRNYFFVSFQIMIHF